MSDDTVTVELEMSQDRLDALSRVRRKQRAGRGTRTNELEDEEPARIIGKLLMKSYRADIRRAERRDEDSVLGGKWR